MRQKRWNIAQIGGFLPVPTLLAAAAILLAAWVSSSLGADSSPRSASVKPAAEPLRRTITTRPSSVHRTATDQSPSSRRPETIRRSSSLMRHRSATTRPTETATPATQPGMSLQAHELEEVSDEELARLEAEARRIIAEEEARQARGEEPPSLSPDEPRPLELGPGEPPPPPRPAIRPSSERVAHPRTQPASPTVRRLETRPSRSEESKRAVEQEGPDLKKPGWWKLPPEERPYFFTWYKTPFEKVCADMEEMTGLSMVGLEQIDPKTVKPISFQSVKLMTFDEALTTFNTIMQEQDLWLVRCEGYLVIRRLTEWYRHIQPEHMFMSEEAYVKASLPPWEIASMIFEPKNASADMLAGRAVDGVPINAARATVVPDSNRIELVGTVYYIEQQLEIIKKYDVPPSGDGREWVEYPLKYAAPKDAAQLLLEMLPAADSGSQVTPQAQQPSQVRRMSSRSRSVAPTPQPVEIGTSTADEVEIQDDDRRNLLRIKATAVKHKLVKEYLEKYIDLPSNPGADVELIPLKHADPAEVIEMIQPLLGQRQLIQQPAPPPQKGKPAQPAPPPRITSIGSMAVMTPIPQSRSILVKATADEMAQIKKYIEIFDVVDQEGAKYQLVTLEHVNASNVATILSSVITARGARSPGQEPFRAIADQQSDKKLVLSGERQQIDEAKELIAQIDVDSKVEVSEHLVKLVNAVPSTLSQILANRYGGSAEGGSGRSSRYSRYSSRGDSGLSADDLPKFIPDDLTMMLIVLCQEEMWPDIQRLINDIDEQSQVQDTTKTYRLEYGDASSISSILSRTLGSSPAYKYSLSAPSFMYDAQSNILVVTGTDQIQEQTAKLVAELDKPSPEDQVEFKAIELEKAEADYVAGKIEELFGQDRYDRYRRGPAKPQVRVVPEPVSNRVLVSACQEDFAKAQELALRIDQDYAAQQYERKTFILKHAQAFDVEKVVQSFFPEASGGSRYGRGGSSSMPGGVKISDTENGVVVLAPKDKMEQIEKLIADLDTDPTKDNEIKTYKLEAVDSRGTYDIAYTLTELFGARGRRQQSNVKFLGDSGSDLLVVSAPSSKMPEIDKMVAEILKSKASTNLTFSIRHFEIKEARPEAIVDMIEPVLQSKYQELLQTTGGRGQSYRYGSEPQIIAHKTARKIMVSAPDSLMPLVEELIKEFDRPAEETTIRFITLKTAKPEDVAPVVEAQMAEPGRSFSSGYRSSRRHWNYTPSYTSSSTGDDDELQVTPVPSSNAIILRGPIAKVAEAEKLIVKLDAEAIPDGPMFRIFEIKHADVYDVVSMIEDMVGGGSSGSSDYVSSYRRKGGGSVVVKSDYYSNKIFVSAPFDKFPMIEQIINMREQMALAAEGSEEVGGFGEVVGKGKGTVTKSYDVDASLDADAIAKTLDDMLYLLEGFDAPYVTSFPYANQVIVEGKPEQFKRVEERLEQILKNPPRPKMMLIFRRVKSGMPASKIVDALKMSASSKLKINIEQMPQFKRRRDPLEMIKEIDYDQSPATTQPAAPFVPTGTLRELTEAVSALSWTQAVKVTVATPETQPATSTQPAEASQSTTTKPAEAPSTKPAEVSAPKPADETAVKTAAKPAPKPVEQPTPKQTETVATDSTQPPEQSSQDLTRDVIQRAALDAWTSGETQIKYDEDEGLIYVVTTASRMDEIQELLDGILEQFEAIEGEIKSDIKVFELRHVDVNVAAAILEQMFNDRPAAKGKQAKPEAQEKPKAAKQPKAAEEEEESTPVRRRRQEEEEAKKQEAAEQAGLGGQRIRVFPDPRTHTLIIRALPEDFPAIAELILKIDREGGGTVDIKIFQLKNLNAFEVEQAIKAILKIDTTESQRLRNLPLLGGREDGAAFRQAQMIEQLQQQILEMQSSTVEGEEGKLKINPAKEITITSDATTNSIIVSAPAEGMKLVESLINELEKQQIPIEVKTFVLVNGDAEKVAIELEKVFKATRRAVSGRGGEGITPSDIGEIKISADSRTNTLVVRALKNDMEKVEPIITKLDVPLQETQVTIYPIQHGTATEMAVTLTKIFVEGSSAGAGPQAVRIAADADTNTVFVWAPANQQEIIGVKIAELDKMASEWTSPKQIQLKIASATEMAAKLQDIFIGKGVSSKGLKQRIHIEGDDNSRTLFVTAPEEMIKEIENVVQVMDTATTRDVKVYKLKYTIATDALKMFQEMTRQLLQQLRGNSGTDVFAAAADPLTNSLIVTGTPATFLAVEKVLAEIDVDTQATSLTMVAMYGLTKASAPSVVSTINSLFATQRFSGGAPPPTAVAEPNTNVVYVYGTKAQIQQIKKDVIDPLEAYQAPTDAMIAEYQIPIQHASVENVSQTLQSWFQARASNLQRAGYSGVSPADMAVTIVPDPSAKQIFVSCSEKNKKLIDTLLQTMDKPEVAEAARQVKVFPLKYAEPAYTTQAISQAFARQGRVPESERVVVTPEYGTNSLVVSANAENMQKIEEMLATLDSDTGAQSVTETIKVNNARAADLAVTLTQAISSRRRTTRTGQLPATFTAIEATNSLLVAASAKEMESVKTLIGQLDVAPDPASERSMKLYLPQYADMNSVINIINTTFAKNISRNPRDQVTAVPEWATGTIVVYASPENHQKVEEIIKQIDSSDTSKTMKAPETIKIKNVRASDLAATLNQMITRTKNRDRQTGTYPITVTADDTANSLLITANAKDMAEMKGLIGQLDTQPAEDERTIRPYVLKFADLGATRNIILKRFADQERRPLSDQVSVEPDYTTGALVVTASEANHAKVAEIIKDLDDSTIVDIKAPETIKIKNVKASELAKTLNEMIRQSKRPDQRTRTYPVTVTPNDAANTLLVTANAKDMEQMKKLIEELDIPQDVGDERLVKPYFLKEADISSIVNIINSQFANNRSLSVRDQVEALAEYATNSVVVTASEANHAKVQALIDELDKSEVGTRKTYTIELQYADPQELAQALTTIYRDKTPQRGRRVPPLFAASPGSSKLLATCTVAELEDVKALVAQMDVSEIEERGMRVVSVHHIAPREMATLLSEYMSRPGSRSGSLLDDVRITSSDSAGAVVITGPTARLDELEQLVKQVDAAAPEDEQSSRQIAVIPLTNADPNSVANMIIRSFAKPGSAAEADRVDAAAELGTNSVVVTASADKIEKIRKMIEELDKESANVPHQEIIRLTHAQAEDLAYVLTQTIRYGKRARSGDQPISITSEPSSNALVISATQADMEGIRKMVEELDKPATDNLEELRVIPLKYIDADETLQIMTEYLRKPAGSRGRGRSGSDLAGDIRLQSSQTMSALIVSGSKEEIDRVETLVKGMDTEEVTGEGLAPKMIKVKHGSASQLASTLTRLFTEPATQNRRSRTNQEMIPLILADESTNSLVVRARPVDYKLIEDMTRRLDIEAVGPTGMEVIPLSRGVDVVRLAREIENTVNQGQVAIAKQQPGYRPSQIVIGVDERAPAFIVSGSPELFKQVKQLLETLQNLKPTGSMGARIIKLRSNIPAEDMKRVIEQLLDHQKGGSSSSSSKVRRGR